MASSKLTAKAARLDFSSLPGAGVGLPPVAAPLASAAEPVSRPKTAPGAMMAFANDARSELLRENEQLRQRAAEADQLRGQLDDALGDLQQWDGAKAARLIDPRLIDISRFANRHEKNYSGPEFAALRAEIDAAGGNVQPIKVRSLAVGEGGEARYEVVYGHRRHRACLELGLPVLAVIDNLDDRTLFVEMDRENRARKDLSAWEQGMMYRRALQQGLFPSNRKLAEAIGVDLSALGKALALAELPDVVVQAFATPLDLQFRWAKPLGQALALRGEAVLAAARTLASGPADRPARAVFDQLVAAGLQGVEPFHPPAPLPLLVDGTRVGTVSCGPRGEVTVALFAGAVQVANLPALADALQAFVGLTAKTARG
jgi:ParB family chromosome partitioning protein